MTKFTDLLPPDGPIDPRLLNVEVAATRHLGDDEAAGQMTNWNCSLELPGDVREWVASEEPDMAWAAGREDALLARALVRVLPLYRGIPLFDALDSVDGDLAAFVALVRGDRLVDELEDMSPFGSDLVIIDRVQVAPKWRGRKLGRLLVSHVLSTIGGSARLVALVPGAFEHQAGTPERAVADDALIAMWAELGFEVWERDEREGPLMMIADGEMFR